MNPEGTETKQERPFEPLEMQQTNLPDAWDKSKDDDDANVN